MLSLFYTEKIMFVRKYIWKNLVYIFTFVLQFFGMAGYWKCSNKTSTTIQICIDLLDTGLRQKILDDRLDILA